ncbi:uncharacterized protein LOC115211861 [Octopus sinensis]|uniref:Uncharacterized protein LOC115211861 n=1 Tax=Octopus sinensis TaxID=2607531 RepID=A0A6P7SEJ7_9MOLL|nr:uncharacterized protein LOC115211861 [Octopus sinensis]
MELRLGHIIFLAILVHVNAYCDTLALRSCLRSISPHNIDVSNYYMQHLDKKQINAFCQGVPEFKECTKPLYTSCYFDKVDLYGVFDYMCGPGRGEFLEYSQCFNDTNYLKKTKTCTERMKVQHLHVHSIEEVCALEKEVRKCALDTAGECSPGSRHFMSVVLDKSLKKVLDSKCSGLSHEAWMGIYVAIAVTIGVAIAGIVIGVKHYKQKNNVAHSRFY